MPEFSDIVVGKFGHVPTEGQMSFFKKLDSFVQNEDNNIFLLKGYAGTGKTSIVSALVKTLPLFNLRYLLLAPTGRAAKVMSSYTERSAFTIHKIIYKQMASPGSGELKFKLQKNYNKNTVFIVDEASMLTNKSEFGGTGVLHDLIQFIFSNSKNKILFIGDLAQLPPVGQSESVGLLSDFYKANGHKVEEIELKDVMRQETDSGILHNATILRQNLNAYERVQFATRRFKDIFRVSGTKLEDGLRYCYDKYGVGSTAIICRSNKNAVQYNTYIRRQIHFTENELDAGDIIMVVRNNYHYTPEGTPSGFIANGDFLEVRKISSIHEMHGFQFADLELAFYGGDGHPFEARVILDTLYTESPALTREQNMELYRSVSQDYQELASKKERREAINNDPYLNALQIKFAYALTCHKSQGGQWAAVLVDQGYVPDENKDIDQLRWLYTAMTRATKELFLVNFKNEQFAD